MTNNNLHSFSQIGLAACLQQTLAEIGFNSMTAVQQQAIPQILNGNDVLAVAQTGTGKTAAYALPIIQKILAHANDFSSPAKHPVRAVILAPTRELVVQIEGQIKLFAQQTKLRYLAVYGGVDIKQQKTKLQAGVEIIIATPGRLLDHCGNRNVVLNQTSFVVLDEADRMLDIGFLPDLLKILAYLPSQRNTLLFSATFSPEIKKLANSFLKQPAILEIQPANSTATTIEQKFLAVAESAKVDLLCELLRTNSAEQAFLFTNSKATCARLARQLMARQLNVAALHGNMEQLERLEVLDKFKANQISYLVATDVAARGLDIKDVPLVVNYDLPYNAEDYVHRIGRTGRAGTAGAAVSFVTDSEKRSFEAIKKITKQQLVVETAAPKTAAKAFVSKALKKSSDPIFDNPYSASTEPEIKSNPTPPTTSLKRGKTLPALLHK